MPPEVRLRPYTAEDAARYDAEPVLPGAIDFFEWHPTNGRQRQFGADGLLGAGHGSLVIDVDGIGMVGDVGWVPVFHGPPPHGEALNIGIGLFAEHRALTNAGFTREGVLRHSQWPAGAFHDNVLFSRLRGD